MKIAFMTLGCKLNYAETSTYERGFRSAGFEVVSPKGDADLYLINTCSVTATSDAKSRSLVHRVHRLSPDARIIVTGCSAQLRREVFEQSDGVWKVFGCKDKSRVVEECLQDLGINADCVRKSGIPDGVFGAYSSGERTRSFLKVQDGCDNFCAYCTVPYARGASRSIPIAECVCMAKEIAAQGVKEIVLTGVNTGDFGRSTGESFPDLLKALNEVEGIERYRISSIEPNLLSEEIIDWIASGTKIQPHFHIPLQAGSNELLSSMGRHYTTEFFEQKINSIREKMGDGVFFGIDVMAGLPGESDELFNETLEFLRRIRPAFIHCFPYSRRPGTKAAAMPEQVDEKTKKERVAALEELCNTLHEEFVESQKGTRQSVLFESREKGGMMSGYTGNYIRVSREWDAALCGQIVEVVL